MTTSPEPGLIPEWTRGDRLRKARATTGMTTREFAAHIGVAQKTITDAENDKRDGIRKILLNAWALATGVPAAWLENGTTPAGPEGPDGGQGYTPSDSNREPADYTQTTSDLRFLRTAA